jgi:predicted PurR-regulated permease PerM
MLFLTAPSNEIGVLTIFIVGIVVCVFFVVCVLAIVVYISRINTSFTKSLNDLKTEIGKDFHEAVNFMKDIARDLKTISETSMKHSLEFEKYRELHIAQHNIERVEFMDALRLYQSLSKKILKIQYL